MVTTVSADGRSWKLLIFMKKNCIGHIHRIYCFYCVTIVTVVTALFYYSKVGHGWADMTRYDWGQGWSQRRDASGVLTHSSLQPAQCQRSSSSGRAIPGNNFAANPPLSVCRIVTIVHQVPAPPWSDYAAQGPTPVKTPAFLPPDLPPQVRGEAAAGTGYNC